MNKRYWLFIMLTVFILAALLLPACTKEEATVTTPKTLKLSYTQPKGASIAKGFEWFGPEFEKRTDGRYKIEIYPGSTLVSISAALDALKGGICEIVMTSIGSFPKDFPLTGVASLPTLGFYPKTVADYSVTYDAAWEFINNNPEIQNEFKDYKLLFPFVLDPYNLVSKSKAIHSAADFKGLKVGGSGGKQEIVSGNGGAAVQQVPPQTYDNLQKGVIDAAFVTFSQVGDYHLYDLCNYYYTQDFGGGFIIMLMNWDAWNAMSSKDQKTLMQTWVDASKESAQGSLDSIAEGKKATLAAGKTITDPTDAEKAAWITASAPAFKKWSNDAIALGISSATVDKILANWTNIQKKYTAKIK
jgi:TRAP-type C4-dicarboxylate transport system substrate-binding protein